MTRLCGRKLEPEDEEGLEGIVEGEIVKDGSKGNGFKEIEEAKDDPVCQPLNVVLMAGRLDRLERQISWEEPSNQVGNGGSEGINEDEN